jgi:hypothetical protein
MSGPLNAITVSIYYKFTPCCGGEDIFFSGLIAIVSGTTYKYVGTTPFPGTGGSLEPGYCYTVVQLTTQLPISYPIVPNIIFLVETNKALDCDDPICTPCTTPVVCECPPGFTEIDGECIQVVEVEATYTGGLLTVGAGDKVTSYSAAGIRLYSDISTAILPVLGMGASNALYSVKDNNGLGAVIPVTNQVMSTLWGSWGPCPTGTIGGRLNTVGIWAPGFPVNVELCFDFCVIPTETKQYLIGIAGDNKVKLYIDNVLTVYLNVPNDNVSVPFTSWHVFPITLTAGTHTITLCGINLPGGINNKEAFGAEIYDIDLATFQSTLLNPALGPGNCGNVPADLVPFTLFSTANMLGLQVPDPNDPGIWECPEGSVLDECQGVPLCTIETKFELICPCFLLIPCDGVTPPFISNTNGLIDYVNTFVSVSNSDVFTGCVFVVELEDPNCEGAIVVTINPETVCDCDTICYYIEGAQGITYIQDGVLINIDPASTPPWITLCSQILPITGNTSDDYTITALGDCIDNVCPEKCFKLTDCEDPTNIIYSNTAGLIVPAINGSIIRIAGYDTCWIVEESPLDECDCPIEVIILITTDGCDSCKTVVAYKLTSCTGIYDIQYTYQDLSAYVGQTLLTDCGCFIVELINFVPPSTQVIVIITSFINCFECERPYYRLTDCNDPQNIIYTYTDLSLYVGLTVKLNNCDECWTVALAIVPINPGSVIVISDYIDCITCITSAPCICTTIKNQNLVEYTYDYVDCYGDTQTLTLQPGETSDRICLIKWLLPEEDCDILIFTETVSSVDTIVLAIATGVLANGKKIYNYGTNKTVAYNGTTWEIYDASGNPLYNLGLVNNLDCPQGDWQIISSIPVLNPRTISSIAFVYYATYFGNCDNGVCPPKVYPLKSLTPGYNTPFCSIWKYEEITCRSAELLYKSVLELRYGISNCCPEELDDLLIKKQLIDLDSLRNPNYICKPLSSCCNRPASSCNCGN